MRLPASWRDRLSQRRRTLLAGAIPIKFRFFEREK